MSKNGYILSIDQGTTSSRAAIVSEQGKIISQKNIEFPQYFPKNGWVEHNPKEILSSTIECIKFIIQESQLQIGDIRTAGITNQRETIVAWNKETGEPVYNAIVWQDRRTEDICAKLISDGHTELFQKKTGLIIDPYFSASKIKWLLENVEEAQNLLDQGKLIIGTIDTWLIWNLTNRGSHFTDATNASRTLIYNIQSDEWDEQLLDIFNIPKDILPEVKNSADDFGNISKDFFGYEIPINGVAGDQQAAAFGQLCFGKGDIKSTYGTGCFMLMNTGDSMPISESKLLATTAYKLDNKKIYALEGSIFNAGTVVQWMRDEMKFFSDAHQVEDLARQSKNNITFIPAFTGLGAPYWKSDIRGSIHGITRDTSQADIALAALKSICFQSKDLLLSFLKDTHIDSYSMTMKVDGGMSKNNLMMQFLSDLLRLRIERPVIQETTVMGAAFLAGIYSGMYKSIDELRDLWNTDYVFEPKISEDHANDLYENWLTVINNEVR